MSDKRSGDGPVLLSGGNPQIAKGDGDGPVQAWIAAAPGWKGEVAREIDALIARSLPDVRKAVRWNSPFYGVGEGWIVTLHYFTKYVKLSFLRGTALDPAPPVAGKDPDVRSIHLHEGEALDEALVGNWMRQAAALPGWRP